MGDFNIPSLDSPLFQAITSTGLRLPTALAPPGPRLQP